MFNLPLSLLELQRGNRTLADLKVEIEQSVGTAVVDARDLLEELETTPMGRGLDQTLRRELASCILTAETTRLTELRSGSPPAEGAGSTPGSETTLLADSQADGASPGGADDAHRSDTTVMADPQLDGSSAGDAADTVAAPGAKAAIGVGTVLAGRFELEESIGSGGMSQVFRALDRRRADARSRSPYVALKVMTVGGANFSLARDAMQREAERSQRLNHPGIVRVHDYDHDDSVVYMTMELLSGRPLSAIIKETDPPGLPDAQAAEYAERIAEALGYAHGKGIVHADLKPSNVFVTDDDEVKVIDFGIARALPKADVQGGSHTLFDARKQLGAVTPAYASAEMLADEPPDPRDDLYSLGCIAFEMYTGRHPFAGVDAIRAQANGLVLRRPEQIPAKRWRAIEHALAFDRAQRTADADTFLREFAAGSAIGAPVLAAAAGAAAVLVVAVGVFLFWPTGEPSAPVADPVRDCADCPALMAVAPGAFRIGLPEADRSEHDARGFFEFPEVAVSIPAPFHVGMHEVTVGEFRAFAASVDADLSGCRSVENDWQPDPALSWSSPGFAQSETHPATCVSWNDAQRYVEWLSERTGERYRLPSEAEWEFVARQYVPLVPAGEAHDCAVVNGADAATRREYAGLGAAACSDGHAYTAPVDRPGTGAVPDLLGNVFEWTQDCWSASHRGIPEDGAARSTADCEERVLRGGSWFTAPAEMRVTFRNRFPPDYRSNTFGFRVARDLGGPK